MAELALRVQALEVSYGGIAAVKGISLEVRAGELTALIGANGAGKTSSLKAITGMLPWRGQVEFFGQSIAGVATHQLAAQGLALVPEGRGVFARMSILENLQMGAYSQRSAPADTDADIERMLTLFPRLRERSHQLAGTLSGGEQQMLAMARALMGRPRLLLLDEPSMGLAPILVEKIFTVIRSVSASGTSILLVEQNARLALACAHRGYVMESGTITLSDTGSALLNDPRVRRAYLGEDGP
jgi:branched-chain amino acid transport system ATP-binding protein